MNFLKFNFIIIGLISANILCGQTDTKVRIFDEDSKLTGNNVIEYKRFSPSNSDFTFADSLVSLFLVHDTINQDSSHRLINVYRTYYKQVYGLIDEKGDRILLFNCFCRLQGHEYWIDETVSVRGGGDCFFRIKINLKNSIVYDLFINAPL